MIVRETMEYEMCVRCIFGGVMNLIICVECVDCDKIMIVIVDDHMVVC